MEEKINRMRQMKAKAILVVFGALGLHKKEGAENSSILYMANLHAKYSRFLEGIFVVINK